MSVAIRIFSAQGDVPVMVDGTLGQQGDGVAELLCSDDAAKGGLAHEPKQPSPQIQIEAEQELSRFKEHMKQIHAQLSLDVDACTSLSILLTRFLAKLILKCKSVQQNPNRLNLQE